MRIVKVREIYTVDTISKFNNKAWELLGEVANEVEEETLFDFKGIDVVEPWCNDSFKKFIGNEKVNMKLYSSEKTAKTIDMACKLGGMKTGRFFNEEIVVPPTLSIADKKIIRNAKELQDYFEVVDGVAVLNVHKRYDQIGSVDTVSYIEKAFYMYSEEHGIKDFVLNLHNNTIQHGPAVVLVEALENLANNDIKVEVKANDQETMSKLSLNRNMFDNKNITLEDKIRMINKYMPNKMAGMLIKYRDSRSPDKFGRYGNGEPISCRVALFNGIVEHKGEDCVSIRTYNGNSFYTKIHWALENDGEELEELEIEELFIPIEQIGILDRYLGSRYHFVEALQYDKEDYTIMYDIDENDKVIHNKLSIPERIKAVFDDWKIEYNVDKLNETIKKAEEMLEKMD